jgi:hypothetical protein
VAAVAQAPAGLSVLGARDLLARTEDGSGAPRRVRLGAFSGTRKAR